MAAVTTISNDIISLKSPTDFELLVYTTNKAGQLLLGQRDAIVDTKNKAKPPTDEIIADYVPGATPAPPPAGGGGAAAAAASGTPTGKIAAPSQLTSFSLNNLPTVYGIIDGNVCKVSPVGEVLQNTDANIDSNTPSLAGCSDGSTGWLYFYKSFTPEGSTQKKQILKEWTIGAGFINEAMDTKVNPSAESSLAAVYLGGGTDGNSRRVIYQGDDSTLLLANPDSGDTDGIKTATHVKKKTPIAACVTRDGEAQDWRIYVYFIESNGAVNRCFSANNSDAGWGPQEKSALTTAPYAFTHLSVTPNPAERVNYVTYVIKYLGPGGGNKYRIFKDPWVANA